MAETLRGAIIAASILAQHMFRLYVNGASQPALTMTNRKLGNSEGSIALRIDHGTEEMTACERADPNIEQRFRRAG